MHQRLRVTNHNASVVKWLNKSDGPGAKNLGSHTRITKANCGFEIHLKLVFYGGDVVTSSDRGQLHHN